MTHTAPGGSDGEVSTIKQVSRAVTIFCCFVHNLGRFIYKRNVQSNTFNYVSLSHYIICTMHRIQRTKLEAKESCKSVERQISPKANKVII